MHQSRCNVLRINGIKAIPTKLYDKDRNINYEYLKALISKKIRIKPSDIKSVRILKESIDARKKPDVFFFLSLIFETGVNEKIILSKKSGEDIIKYIPNDYHLEVTGQRPLCRPPLIVGSGPAGLFCALSLARLGFKPIVIEQGSCVEKRTEDIENFHKSGKLNPFSNVQFGEGGAGTFSDGKLNTLVKDKDGKNAFVLKTFCEFGAKEEICYNSKPHLGTDKLCEIVRNMRLEIIRLGGQVYFDTKFVDYNVCDDEVCEVICENGEIFETGALILAIGHSARDTVEFLHDKKKLPMEAKSFAVGFRVQHPQSLINKDQYGVKDPGVLMAAPYKLTAKAGNRNVYSFCMCPGGYVVNSSSEEGKLVVNGMSYSGRDSNTANSAIIVNVNPSDYGSTSELAGIEFQRRLEEKAYDLCKGAIPYERFREFAKDLGTEIPEGKLEVEMCFKGDAGEGKVSCILPEELSKAFVSGMLSFDRILPGFADGNVIVAGIESRTSSPVRIIRNEEMVCQLKNLYPCGEGAGYAGGITSAAMDGLRVAEKIASKYKPGDKL